MDASGGQVWIFLDEGATASKAKTAGQKEVLRGEVTATATAGAVLRCF